MTEIVFGVVLIDNTKRICFFFFMKKSEWIYMRLEYINLNDLNLIFFIFYLLRLNINMKKWVILFIIYIFIND